MNNTLYLQYITDAERCPECREPYSIQFKDGEIRMVCYSCGWEQATEKFGSQKEGYFNNGDQDEKSKDEPE